MRYDTSGSVIRMNDWEIKKFLGVVLAVQLVMWGAIGLDAIGWQIPVIRQFIGFIYLTFMPGIIIVRILKLHKLGNVETLLYTVGLSIATLMFTGLFMNAVYPLFGISGPISLVPLIITMTVIVSVLCIVSYIRDKDFAEPTLIGIKEVLSPPVLFLCLLPLLSIFGTYLINVYHNNVLLMLLIIAIAFIVGLIAFGKFVPEKLYPLAVGMIAIALLLHSSLISQYLIGDDIQIEYYFSNLVILNSHWTSTIYNNVNAMLSITMLAPIYSVMSNISITWVFKILYPLLFSLVPLGLYCIFQKQTSDKIAFLSGFFFVSFFCFYTEMLGVARGQIATLFFVLLILLMVSKEMDKIKRSSLFIIFGISLAVSHYGLSYIYIFFLISLWLILFLIDNLSARRLRTSLYSKLSRHKGKAFTSNPTALSARSRTLSSTFVLLFIVFALAWYMYISSSSTFDSIVRIGNHIYNTMLTEFLVLGTRGETVLMAIGMGTFEVPSLQRLIHLILQYITQFFIIVGVIKLILKNKEMKFATEYGGMVFGGVLILGACILLPHFAEFFNATRFYSIALLFLAPLCIIGGETILRGINRLFKFVSSSSSHIVDTSIYLKLLTLLILIPYFMFNVQFIYIATGDVPTTCTGLTHNEYLFKTTCERDISAANWLSSNTINSTPVYSGHHPYLFLWANNFFPREQLRYVQPGTEQPDDGYIYLNYGSLINNRLLTKDVLTNIFEYTSVHSATFLHHANKIYDNGAQIYYIK